MERRILVLGILLIIVAISGGLQVVRSVSATSSLRPHPPILIDGNAGFVPQNGVTFGNGTAQNPWVIEGWSIASAQSQAAVEIEHTTDFFVIRNVEALSGFSGIGIYFLNVSHGSILNSTLNGNDGLRIEGSPDITISRDTFIGGQILVLDSDQGPLSENLVIANNTLVDTTIWIGSCTLACLQTPSMMKVEGNIILSHNNMTDAMFVAAVGATIANNTVIGAGTGLTVEGSASTVRDNILQTTRTSIGLVGVNSTTLSGNIMMGGGIGIGGAPSPYDHSFYYDSHSIAPSNLVNGKPVLYYSRCGGLSLMNKTVGQLIIASCSVVDIANVTAMGKASAGIFLAYVTHARLVRDHISGNCEGLVVTGSSDVSVADSEIALNKCLAVSVSQSTGFAVLNSIVSQNGGGLSIDSSTNATVTGNLFASNNYNAIRLQGDSTVVVSKNRIQDNSGIGLLLDTIVNGFIEGNSIMGNTGAGMSIGSANGLNITANTLIYNYAGISLGGYGNSGFIYNTIVYHNNFVYNIADQADHYYGIVLKWDNGYASGGNYWADYTGVDKCSGVNQDVCPQPDGIGDTPYTGIIQLIIMCYSCSRSSPLVDHYPLMKPFGNVTQDSKPPQWPSGSTLALTRVNLASVSLQWSKASDDTWVSTYLIAENGTIIGRVQGNVISYTVSGLTPGATYVFKIDGSDPGDTTSIDGPSSIITLLISNQTPNPSQGQNPKPTPTGQSNTSPFTLAWWMQNPTWGYIIGAIVAVVTGSMLLIRRQFSAKKPAQHP